MAVAWLAFSLRFWLWWFAPGRGAWQVERVMATVCLGSFSIMGAYFLFFACRMLKPNNTLPTPALRVAFVVTKAPSEPWEILEQTLSAMLDQAFPYPYDTWLADEQPSEQVRLWCDERGVGLSTRYGIEEYHQPNWPRRIRCKEGNLAYFYDTFGYDGYDVVAQLDSDHVPSATYLREIIAPFRDPAVGYVAAPSICDANADAGWTVRGRLHREATMHGPAQAGANDGWGPVCIGSHYAVRTRALRSVGGLGPELAEDYSTTLVLLAGGWSGVFAIDAEAHGAGPETLNDMLVQETQWARSLGAIFTGVFPRQVRTVPWRARARMTFALLCYPFQAVTWLVGACLPAVGVLTETSWGEATFADFYLRIWACSMLLLVAVWWLRRAGTLRPASAKIWSVDLVLFQLVRWPWTAWGFFRGMFTGRRRVPVPFRVTPKQKRSSRDVRLSARTLSPLVVLTLAPASVLAVAHPVQSTLGLYVLLLGQTLLYASVLVAVVVLHYQSRGSRGRPVSTHGETSDSFFERIMTMDSEPEADPICEDEMDARHPAEASEHAFTIVPKGWDPAEVSEALNALRLERDALLASSAADQQLTSNAAADAADVTSSERADRSAAPDVFGQLGDHVAEILRAAEKSAGVIVENAIRDAETRRQQAEERAQQTERESLALLDDAAARVTLAQDQADALLAHARAQSDDIHNAMLTAAAEWHRAGRGLHAHLETTWEAIGQSLENLPSIVRDNEMLTELTDPMPSPTA
ncbi:MAG: glycosyltransferase family 2 protein [Jatrophihabitans sp.]